MSTISGEEVNVPVSFAHVIQCVVTRARQEADQAIHRAEYDGSLGGVDTGGFSEHIAPKFTDQQKEAIRKRHVSVACSNLIEALCSLAFPQGTRLK